MRSLRPQPHFARILGEEVVVLGRDSLELPVRFNGSGAVIWRAFVDGADFDQLVAIDEDKVDAAVRRRAVSDFMVQLEALGLAGEEEAHGAVGSRVDLAPADGITAASPRSLDDLLLWLARVGSHDAPSFCLEQFGEGEDVVTAAEQAGSVGQLAWAIDMGWIDSEETVRDLVQERWAANQLHCLRVEQQALDAIALLDCAGIPIRLVKGVATAHLDYADPSRREFGDADLLIAEDAWDHALEVLLDNDQFSRQDQAHPQILQADKGATLLGRGRIMVDTHRRIALGGIGARPVECFFDDPQPFALAGVEVFAPSEACRLVHALVHWFVSKSIRPGTLRDFTNLRHVDPHKVAAIAGELRVTGVVQVAASSIGELLDLPELAELSRRLKPTRAEQLLSRRGSVPYNQDLAWRELSGVLYTPGVRNKLGYAADRKEMLAEPLKRWRRSGS